MSLQSGIFNCGSSKKGLRNSSLSAPPIAIADCWRAAITTDHRHFDRQNSCRKSCFLEIGVRSPRFAIAISGSPNRYPITLRSSTPTFIASCDQRFCHHDLDANFDRAIWCSKILPILSDDAAMDEISDICSKGKQIVRTNSKRKKRCTRENR